MFLLYILFWPGYLTMWFSYFFPTEWGKGRNVSSSGRQFRSKGFNYHFFAFIYSLIWYMLIAAALINVGPK
jgi:hypothetical protein